MNRIGSLCARIYSDFLLPNRLNVLENIFIMARETGYEFIREEDFCIQGSDTNRKIILRHDIDTDLTTTRLIFDLEKKYSVKSSYFFRRTTIDIDLLQEIYAFGSTVGYHYEEIATFAKRNVLLDAESVYGKLPQIQDLFYDNLQYLRKITDLPLNVAASHGDFMNRNLGIPNRVLLSDLGFRKKCLIDLEVYDEGFRSRISSYTSDRGAPGFWISGNPLQILLNQPKNLYILIHPRHWRANPQVNLIDNGYRLLEDLFLRLGLKR
jgi:hypothetical protein